jgi:carbon-monoxide dehydrogenase large subunit
MVGIEGFDSAYVALGADGRATVWTTTPAIGQGSDTTFAQLLADLLGLTPEQVTVAPSDTAVGELEGTGTFASRSAVSGGGAVDRAGLEIRGRLLTDAAERLEAAIGDLELVGGQVRVVGSPSSAIPARYAHSERWDPPAVAYPYATHACVVEDDPGTGAVRVRRYVVVEDCGRVINPMIVDGQVHGATAQGIATAPYEGMVYSDEGQLQTATLVDYLVPTAGEVPPLHVEHLEIPSPTTPHGVKGVGEGGTVGAPAAVVNAVCHAIGQELGEVPITPQRVLEAMVHP